MSERITLSLYLVLIIVSGVGSRVFSTGIALIDKYMGDALYAAMFYVIIRLLSKEIAYRNVFVVSMVLILAIEVFQLTMIPAMMSRHESALVRLLSRLLGTQFGVLDILSYIVGIALIYMIDASFPNKQTKTQ